jgi:hypothetical protein
MSASPQYQIRDLTEHDLIQRRTYGEYRIGTYWTGRIVMDGVSYGIDSRGGWIITMPDGTRRHLLPQVAQRVQRKLPRDARSRRKAKG